MIFWFRVHSPLMMCMACQCAVSWIWYMCTVKVSLEIISVLLHVSLSVWLVLELEVYRVHLQSSSLTTHPFHHLGIFHQGKTIYNYLHQFTFTYLQYPLSTFPANIISLNS